MTCQKCGGFGRTIRSKVRFSGWRWRRIECQSCGHRWSEAAPPGTNRAPRRKGKLTEAQVVEALTTQAQSRDLARRWQCSHSLVEQVRRRLIYKEIRPDLPQWYRIDRVPFVPLRPEQVEWILLSPLSHGKAGKLVGRSAKTVSVIRHRTRGAYAHVRTDLPPWRPDAPWLVDAPPPAAPEVPVAVTRSCFECIHFGGISLPCTIHNPPLAAMECPEFTPDDDDDDA